jgi:hypothetical protein
MSRQKKGRNFFRGKNYEFAKQLIAGLAIRERENKEGNNSSHKFGANVSSKKTREKEKERKKERKKE